MARRCEGLHWAYNSALVYYFLPLSVADHRLRRHAVSVHQARQQTTSTPSRRQVPAMSQDSCDLASSAAMSADAVNAALYDPGLSASDAAANSFVHRAETTVSQSPPKSPRGFHSTSTRSLLNSRNCMHHRLSLPRYLSQLRYSFFPCLPPHCL